MKTRTDTGVALEDAQGFEFGASAMILVSIIGNLPSKSALNSKVLFWRKMVDFET